MSISLQKHASMLLKPFLPSKFCSTQGCNPSGENGYIYVPTKPKYKCIDEVDPTMDTK